MSFKEIVSPEQALADLDNELLKEIDALNEVMLDQARLKRELFERTEAVRMGKHNVARLKILKEIKTREFWAGKHQ